MSFESDLRELHQLIKNTPKVNIEISTEMGPEKQGLSQSKVF